MAHVIRRWLSVLPHRMSTQKKGKTRILPDRLFTGANLKFDLRFDLPFLMGNDQGWVQGLILKWCIWLLSASSMFSMRSVEYLHTCNITQCS
eukprot:6458682-Amphidinium_carterae.1